MKRSKKASPSLVKIVNRELIINELKENTKISRAELSKKTNLSKPAVSEIVKELIDEGLVFESGVGPSSGGKKPILLEYNSRSSFVIGVLIENETIYLALGDMNGKAVRIIEEHFIPKADGQEIVQLILQGAKKLLSSENIDSKLILGMTVGVSGIPAGNDSFISSSPTINWNDTDLKKELSDALQLPVIIENDVNLMTIGEFHKGQGRNIQNFVYLFIGDGIGSGLILNGQFYKGFHSAAGEIGYMMIGDESIASPNLGVFEGNYGRFGINSRLKKHQLEADRSESIIQILQNNKEHPDISQILDDALVHWAKAAVNIISVIDPEAIILSGELAFLDQDSLNKFTKIVDQYVPKKPTITFTQLGSKAGLYGAFHLALEHFHVAGFKHIQI